MWQPQRSGRPRVVIKLGSSSVTRETGPDPTVLAATLDACLRARQAGWDTVLISSGAVSAGASRLAHSGWITAPPQGSTTASAKLKAAVGQPYLMGMYRRLGEFLHSEVCQLLVSGSDVQSAARMQSLIDVIDQSLQWGIVPIVNGNDAVDHYELDNDSLAAGVAVMLGADVLLLLSDVEGVLDASGALIPTAAAHELGGIPVRSGGSGRGGMASKLAAAQLAALGGVPAVIARAGDPSVIGRTIGGQAVGTRVQALGQPPGPQWSWLAAAAPSTGTLIINREAEESIRNGTSLFGSGIKRLKGEFERGDVVRLVTPAGQLVGRGVVNTGSVLLGSLRALRKDEVNTLLLTCLSADSELATEPPVAPAPAQPLRPQLEQALRTVTSHSPQVRYRITQDILHLLARPALKALVTQMSLDYPTPPIPALDKLPNISIVERHQLYVFPEP